jgi:hypothetical protein
MAGSARLEDVLQHGEVLPRNLQVLLRQLPLQAAAVRQRQAVPLAHYCSERFAVGFRASDVVYAAELSDSRARLPLHVLGCDARQPQHLPKRKISRRVEKMRGRNCAGNRVIFCSADASLSTCALLSTTSTLKPAACCCSASAGDFLAERSNSAATSREKSSNK